jgi:hypothetical protein
MACTKKVRVHAIRATKSLMGKFAGLVLKMNIMEWSIDDGCEWRMYRTKNGVYLYLLCSSDSGALPDTCEGCNMAYLDLF